MELSGAILPEGSSYAVSLAYDGARPDHLETVVPVLERYGLKGSFFLPESGLLAQPEAWRALAHADHEMACHPLFGFVGPDGGLGRWTLEMVRQELEAAQTLHREIFGRVSPLFAYPSENPTCAEGDYRPHAEALFPFVRTFEQGINPLSEFHPQRLRCRMAYDADEETLAAWLEEAEAAHGWLILVFEGVGSGERGVDARLHEAFCERLSETPEIWTQPVTQIAAALRGDPSGYDPAGSIHS